MDVAEATGTEDGMEDVGIAEKVAPVQGLAAENENDDGTKDGAEGEGTQDQEEGPVVVANETERAGVRVVAGTEEVTADVLTGDVETQGECGTKDDGLGFLGIAPRSGTKSIPSF